MAITAAMVKTLRDKTGVGMMECKKALTQAGGDLDAAVKWLRENGMSRAAKKSSRITAEGIVEVVVNNEQNAGVVIEINCETDFASRNESFTSFCKTVASVALANECSDIEKLKTLSIEGGETISDALTNLITTVGENMNIRRVNLLKTDSGVVTGYSHMGGKIGALVVLKSDNSEKAATVGQDIAMHVAAAAPRFLTSAEVDVSELESEKEIARKKLIEEKKPENMIDKILEGQMKKFYKEVCLADQPFIKDPSTNVTKYIEQNGAGAELAAFSRFQLGEGIEKKEENFAEEVAAQLNK